MKFLDAGKAGGTECSKCPAPAFRPDPNHKDRTKKDESAKSNGQHHQDKGHGEHGQNQHHTCELIHSSWFFYSRVTGRCQPQKTPLNSGAGRIVRLEEKAQARERKLA